MQPTYSICITNFNTEDSVRQSLESILAQVDERFEIVVVDNCSTDASLGILREYEDKWIKLIVKRCSRGLGRQIAIENSCGKYMIGQMDMDDVFKPNLDKLLQIYHANFEGYMLALPEIIMIAPRKLIDAIGGYKDLNYLEERDLYSRAAQLGYFKYFRSFKIKEHEIKKRKFHRRIIRLLDQQYLMFRESFRIGQGTIFCYHAFIKTPSLRKKPFVFLARLSVFFWAYITHWFYPQFYNEFVKFFNMDNYEIRINGISI